MRAIVKIAKSGQVSIPNEIREILGAEAGDYLEIDVIGIAAKSAREQEKGKSGYLNPRIATLEPILA
ncbi:MAG: AbrB/MazE/SpoVT family DNA-binding domain-containing protein [Methanothrix sp.]|jgi:AbrB family looped-hinge helix DNA binding protein|nr:AbrB/MazE/SpoVT family DNA-binding domain-containing protein [Methanothrix sp.]